MRILRMKTRMGKRLAPRRLSARFGLTPLLFLFLRTGVGFYLPGVAPTEYQEGSPVELKVNKLTSVKTQLPYRYYSLPYCQPDELHVSAENLGEILLGDSIENTNYDLRMGVNTTCSLLCQQKLTKEHTASFQRMIDNDYQVNWLIDNLPAVTHYHKGLTEKEPDLGETGKGLAQTDGFPVGRRIGAKYFIHNHINIRLWYNSAPTEFEGARIVGFEADPFSVAHEVNGDKVMCPAPNAMDVPGFDLGQHETIIFTYSVSWEQSTVRWSSRWDAYLRLRAGQVHWFSIINSLCIVLFLTGMVAMILLRTLHADIAKYNDVNVDDMAEETGWKLVHGDVFRKPPHSQILAMALGSGLQLLFTCGLTLIFSIVGFLSPVHRGSILQGMLLLFTFAGILSGFASARFYKMWKGENWKRTTLLTAFLYPGTVFVIFFILNLFIWGTKSSGAVPFTTMFALLVLWFGISVPLVFLGAFFGYKKGPITLPVRTNQIPRQIPAQPWFVNGLFTSAIGGVLPFGAIFTEMFFIMSSMWQHQFYYLFGFLLLCIGILLITCAEISITFTYFLLLNEDYNWWWRSFAASASSAAYVFLYSCLYYSTRLQIRHYVGAMVYFGYMFVVSYTFALITGSIGFIASFLFVRKIYGSIKID